MATCTLRLCATVVLATAPAWAWAQTPPIKPGLWEVKSDGSVDGRKTAQPAGRLQGLSPSLRAQFEAAMKEKGVAMGPGGVNRMCFARESMDPARWGEAMSCKTEYGARSHSSWKWQSVCTQPERTIDGEATFANPESYRIHTTTTMKTGDRSEDFGAHGAGPLAERRLRRHEAVDRSAGPQDIRAKATRILSLETEMNGLMMQRPLLISSLLVHAERHHGDQEVVSRRVEGDIHRTTYRELAARSRRMAKALAQLGVKTGERVATLAWNGYRHMELYYAASGSGAVLHTLNPRLHPDQVVYIADHAEDQVLFFDMTFLPLIEAIAPRVKTIRHFVAMTDRAHMPKESKIPDLLCFEELVEARRRLRLARVRREPRLLALLHLGHHRQPEGRALQPSLDGAAHLRDRAARRVELSARDAILPVVPMFHVNAWGLPYAACMIGAKLVFPGPGLDGKSLHELFENERVTISAGVPTVWQGLLAYVEANDLSFSTMAAPSSAARPARRR